MAKKEIKTMKLAFVMAMTIVCITLFIYATLIGFKVI